MNHIQLNPLHNYYIYIYSKLNILGGNAWGGQRMHQSAIYFPNFRSDFGDASIPEEPCFLVAQSSAPSGGSRSRLHSLSWIKIYTWTTRNARFCIVCRALTVQKGSGHWSHVRLRLIRNHIIPLYVVYLSKHYQTLSTIIEHDRTLSIIIRLYQTLPNIIKHYQTTFSSSKGLGDTLVVSPKLSPESVFFVAGHSQQWGCAGLGAQWRGGTENMVVLWLFNVFY